MKRSVFTGDLWLLGSLLALALATAHCNTPARPMPAPDIKPDAEPNEPQDPPEAGAEAVNSEYFLGSKAEEAAAFERFATEIQDIQKRQSQSHKQPIQRGFHAKAHGCLYGEMLLDESRDARTRFGVFSEGRTSWPIWARFSNGVGWVQDDSTLDARGFAVKLMGVPGKKYLDDEKATQDFLMTNSPTPVGRDATEFMKFADANASGTLHGILFLITHPFTAGPALTSTGAIASAVTEQYWSGGAYHLGAHQAIKYTAKPCDGTSEPNTDRDSPDYLRRDLAEMAKKGLCYAFYAQFQIDAERTPIENASKAWQEADSPLVRIATIKLPPQDITSEKRASFCQALHFTPWHATAAHKPMGNINRARRHVYAASQKFRTFGPEPHGFEGFDSSP